MPRIQVKNLKITLTKSHADIEMLPYITAEVSQMNEAAIMAYADIDMAKAAELGDNAEAQKESVNFKTIPVSAVNEIKNDTIKAMVVSIDGEDFGGDKDALFAELKTLPASDFDEIVKKIDSLNSEAASDPKDEQK